MVAASSPDSPPTILLGPGKISSLGLDFYAFETTLNTPNQVWGTGDHAHCLGHRPLLGARSPIEGVKKKGIGSAKSAIMLEDRALDGVFLMVHARHFYRLSGELSSSQYRDLTTGAVVWQHGDMTEIAYDDCVEWLKSARPGDRMIYHVGYLAFARKASPIVDMVAGLFLGAAGYRWVAMSGAMRWELRERPRCILLQRKLGEWRPNVERPAEYIAIKR